MQPSSLKTLAQPKLRDSPHGSGNLKRESGVGTLSATSLTREARELRLYREHRLFSVEKSKPGGLESPNTFFAVVSLRRPGYTVASRVAESANSCSVSAKAVTA